MYKLQVLKAVEKFDSHRLHHFYIVRRQQMTIALERHLRETWEVSWLGRCTCGQVTPAHLGSLA
jgi:hypothetical protein